MLKVTFESETIGLLRRDMTDFLLTFGKVPDDPTALKGPRKSLKKAAPTPNELRGRTAPQKVKNQPEVPSVVNIPDDAEDVVVEVDDEDDAPPTLPGTVLAPPAELDPKEEAMDKLTAVSKIKGVLPARELLAKFNAKRFSDIKEEDYRLFINHCHEILAAK